MFDKRLLAMVPGARKYVVADVLLQWAALAANIFLYFLIGTFLQAVWRGTQTPALCCRACRGRAGGHRGAPRVPGPRPARGSGGRVCGQAHRPPRGLRQARAPGAVLPREGRHERGRAGLRRGRGAARGLLRLRICPSSSIRPACLAHALCLPGAPVPAGGRGAACACIPLIPGVDHGRVQRIAKRTMRSVLGQPIPTSAPCSSRASRASPPSRSTSADGRPPRAR